MGQLLMQLQQILRQQNYNLKNQITDLKNAFDLNRDILKILASQQHTDKHHRLFMQIIDKLTNVNNQVMISAISLQQEKNTLKTENYQLNMDLNKMEQQLQKYKKNQQQCSLTASEANLMLQVQVSSLQRELLAAIQQQKDCQQQLQICREKCKKLEIILQTSSKKQYSPPASQRKAKINRKYTSVSSNRQQSLNLQMQLQIRRLKRYIDQLQNRLIILVKAHQLEQGLKQDLDQEDFKIFKKEQQQINLFKFALNDMCFFEQNNQTYLRITKRFENQQIGCKVIKKKVNSAPKLQKYFADEQKPSNFQRQYSLSYRPS